METDLAAIVARRKDDYGNEFERTGQVTIGPMRVVFRDHVRELCALFEEFPVFVGCVAWLTDSTLLNVMRSKCLGMAVQKEDWLRPDSTTASANDKAFRRRLREQYDLLPHELVDGTMYANNFAHYVHGNNVALMKAFHTGLSSVSPIVCVGTVKDSRDHRANMHHKFVVFGQIDKRPNPSHPGEFEDEYLDVFTPKAVWTGSFNFSKNATRSIENAVLIRDPDVAKAFYEEWGVVQSIGEQLDWEHEYVHPIQRFGCT